MKKFKNIYSKYKKYLPSKRFGIFLGGGLLVVVVFLGISGLLQGKEKFTSKDNLSTNSETLNDLLQSDTDLDGVFDWEEALWGTDKTKKATFNDTPDGVYIKQKKEALAYSDNGTLNETDQFAREFFASYVALKSAGEDSDSINNFSKALGEKIGDPNLVDIYAEGDIDVVVAGDKDDISAYYTDIQDIFEKYRKTGMGDEIDIVNSGLLAYTEKNSKVNYNELNSIGKSYQNFASDMMQIKVPKTYAKRHVDIANSAHNTGVSVISMVSIIDDPIVGLTGITQYQKYSNEFISLAEELEADLTDILE